MTEQAESKHPCLAGGLIHPDQWQLPETSVRKTLRAGIRDILLQLKADFSMADQAYQSLDDLPSLSSARLQRYAPLPDFAPLGSALLSALDELRQSGAHTRQACFLVSQPFSGLPEALETLDLRVISPPANLLMADADIAAWWDEQLMTDDWVIPELADFWLRHRSGLGLIRELMARLAVDQAGNGVVGCSSWCWQFWCQYLPDLYVAPWMPAPLTGECLVDWFGQLAMPDTGQGLTARMTNDGRFVLPAPSESRESRKHSLFPKDLATLARGNPGVALAVWRRALRAKPEESESGDVDAPDATEHCWVAPLDRLSLPKVPPSTTVSTGHVLHSLLLHNGLDLERLAQVTGLPEQELQITLGRLQRADVIAFSGDSQRYRVQPLGYPDVRRYLQARGYPVDRF